MIYLLFGAALMVVPFYIRFERIPIDMLHYKHWFFQFLVLVSIFVPIRKKVPKDILLLLLGILTLAFFNQHLTATMNVRNQFIGFSFGIIFILQSIRLGLDRDKTLNLIAISCIIGSAWIILERFELDPYAIIIKIRGLSRVAPDGKPMGATEQALGFLANPMTTGNYLALAFPALLRKKWLYFAIIPVVAALYLDSATCIVPIVGCISAYLLINYVRISSRIISSLSLAVCLSAPLFLKYLPGFFSGTQRAAVWDNSLSINRSLSVVYGKGVGWFPDVYNRLFIHSEKFGNAHNEFVECYVAFGLIGFCALIYLFYRYWKVNDDLLHIALIPISVICMGAFPFHVAPLALVVIIYFSISINSQGERNGHFVHTSRTEHIIRKRKSKNFQCKLRKRHRGRN